MLKTISILTVISLMVVGITSGSFAQGYPSRPITLVLPMAPGDGVDVAGRAMGDELAKLLKVSIVPLNKPGAAATLGADFVVKSKKDGYTILFTSSPAVVSAKILQPDIVPYDPFKDLIPLGLSTQNPMLMTIRSDAPYRNFKEMVGYAKKNPGKVRCGVMGVGSVGHFNLEIVKMVTGADIDMIPFKGAAPSVTALLGGHVEAVFQAIGPLISHMRSGALKAMVTSVRFPEYAEVPTLKELGYPQGLLNVWFGFFAPAEVPPEVKATLVPAIEGGHRSLDYFQTGESGHGSGL
jgi:tripartite-type tricarboxylate transporter receptor subunit TctC